MKHWKAALFAVSAIWLVTWWTVLVGWGLRPLSAPPWIGTPEDVEHYYPIHLASPVPSAIGQHNQQLLADEALKQAAFDPLDWATREIRCRCTVVYLSFLASGLVVLWICRRIISGRATWESL